MYRISRPSHNTSYRALPLDRELRTCTLCFSTLLPSLPCYIDWNIFTLISLVLLIFKAIYTEPELGKMAKEEWAFIKSNKFWTHGHWQLHLNNQIYSYTWAAIEAKEFRAVKLKLQATKYAADLGVDTIQKGLLLCVFASLPMGFQTSEFRREITKLSDAGHVGQSTKVKSRLMDRRETDAFGYRQF